MASALGITLLALLLALITWQQRVGEVMLRAAFAWQRRRAGLNASTLAVAGQRWAVACRHGRSQTAVVVMIHGFTGSKENWYPLARVLATRDATRDATLWIPDLPGWGDSTRNAGAVHDYAAQAEQVAAFIAEVSPARPVLLLGHSMGGAIAALVAARHPARVAALGLIAAAGVPFTPNAFARETLAGGHPFAVHDRASLHRYLRRLFPDRRTRPWLPWPASRAYIERRRHADAFERAVSAAMAGPQRFLPEVEAARIRVPVRLVWGADDPIIAPDAADAWQARIAQASLTVLPGCGHMVLMERPHAVADAMVPLLVVAAASDSA